ncbi:LysR family transcriptional regulator [Tahibacter soli]|jgi:LysR family hydrogen peroxide-inducible transcriptional activator|uniref:LysR family transcriptional regulator n=1 Tax=Tahibacter soli TaxID=2983605 RepID=A0A9X3YI46_9GAMM|nr:LysR family transcriptional regulator [Tahibacter soli]MDC8011461.1 LysR family transcriptional regulator [Tahibacter soli]
MSIRDLRYLVALADTLHFGKAAERCHVTQSTLSIQVKKLEEYLGIAVFDRNHAKVELTEHGAEIVRQARVAVSAFDRMRRYAGEQRVAGAH